MRESARARDEHEEETLVPGRAARRVTAFRPARLRASWAVIAAALTLSVAAGFAAGIYLIKTRRPAELQAPAVITEDVTPKAVSDVTPEAMSAAKTTDTQLTQPAPEQHESEPRPEASPSSETSPDVDVATHAADALARGENEGRSNSPTPKREPSADATSGRGERANEALHAKTIIAERAAERPARKSALVTGNAPAQPKTVTERRANVSGERTPVTSAPKRPPVLSLPASTKSKKVIQWP